MCRMASLFVVVVSILLMPLASQAVNPSGAAFETTLWSPNGIWNVESQDNAGSDVLCEFEAGLGELCIEILTEAPVIVDSRGRLSGTGSVEFTARIDEEIVSQGSATGPLKGKLEGKNGSSKLRAKFRGEGQANFFGALAGPPLRLNAQFKTEGVTDASGDYLSSTRGKLCIRTIGCDGFETTVDAVNLGSESWDLTIRIYPGSSRHLRGNATADTELGSIPFVIEGTYNAKRDESSLKFTPDDGFKGNKIAVKRLHLEGSDATIEKVTYQIIGHKGAALDASTTASPDSVCPDYSNSYGTSDYATLSFNFEYLIVLSSADGPYSSSSWQCPSYPGGFNYYGSLY